ncbi:Panacea domain-containing protein [Halocatena pleomorpha]|uniref:Panacea domain-containing protein n=1 Tax=Halocatena pleomorpha TaxID=1785090 RepID=UPI00163B280B|nr:Panacea domain-containing protein [Halocatena pleomorpha]
MSEFSGNVLTRTKLVKLLYLADRESYIRRRRQISNIQYIKYHYGPYSEDIVDTVKEMDGHEIIELSGRSQNGTFYQYKSNTECQELKLTPDERNILDKIIQEFSNTPTKELVETVYELDELHDIEKYTPLLQEQDVNERRKAIG